MENTFWEILKILVEQCTYNIHTHWCITVLHSLCERIARLIINGMCIIETVCIRDIRYLILDIRQVCKCGLKTLFSIL